MTLNPELLQQSFELVKVDSVNFTTTFYTTLFVRHPEVEPLFAKTLMHEQGKKLFDSLVLVVDNLQKPEVLSGALKGLGQRHIKYGALPQHYPMIGSALLSTFEQHLQSAWTPEVQQAWSDAYTAVAELMLEGADYPAEAIAIKD
jgi:nitric oxide dioxygenase